VAVTFPADWKDNAWVMVTGRAVPEAHTTEMDGVILCDTSLAVAAGRTHTFSCRVPAPSSGPYTLHAEVVLLNDGQRDYQHVVVPSSPRGSTPP
jgi:hypothetical protein